MNTSNVLSETIIHEARHAWQFMERLEPSLGVADPGFSGPPNDSDGDYWLEEVRFESADLLTEFFSPKQSDTMVDLTPHATATVYQADAFLFDGIFKSLCP